MRRYQCLLLDVQGTIREARVIGAGSDAEAWRMAIEFLHAHPYFRDVEVWERGRRTELEDGENSFRSELVENYGLADVILRKLDRPTASVTKAPAPRPRIER